MRHTYKCPKCASNDVVEVIGSSLNTQHKIPLTKWSMRFATLDRYICVSCGYTEEYVQLTDSFKKWAKGALERSDRKYDDFV